MAGYEEIAACAAAYQQAREDSGWLSDLAAAEAVMRARIALAECLIRAGWTPAPDVDEALTADRALLLQPWGAIEQRERRL